MGRKRRAVARGPVPTVTPKKLLKVIPGTGGILSKIAAALGVARGTISFCIHQREGEAWDKVRELYKDECERVVDKAEAKIEQLIDQDDDLSVSSQTARWYLSKRRPAFAEKQTVVHEGGVNPIQIETRNMVDFDQLDLPVDVRRQVLLAIEKRERQVAEEQDKEARKRT